MIKPTSSQKKPAAWSKIMIIKILIVLLLAYIITSLYIGVINVSEQDFKFREKKIINKIFFPEKIIQIIYDKC